MANGLRSFRTDEFLAFWGEVFIRYRLLGSAITFDEFAQDPHGALARINRLDVLSEIGDAMFDGEPARTAAPPASRERLRGWLGAMRSLRKQ